MGYMTETASNVTKMTDPYEQAAPDPAARDPEQAPQMTSADVAAVMASRREVIEHQIDYESEKRAKANDRIKVLRAELRLVEKLWRAAQPPKPRKAK